MQEELARTMSQSDLFKQHNLFIHPSIPDVLNSQLKALLEHNQATVSAPSHLNQAAIIRSIIELAPNQTHSIQLHLLPNLKPAFDLETTTHVVTNSLHLPEFIALGKSDQDLGDIISFSYRAQSQHDQDQIIHRSIYLVTPLWVTQSYDLNKLQPTRAYSPDPYKFFSGVVVSLDSDSNLPQPDVELIQACVQAWGGQFRRGLTKEVTHLICCDENTRDYKIANKVKAQLGLRIVLPHWFHHSVFFRKIISEVPFEFPSPSILKPRPTSIDPDRQHGLDGIPGTKLGLVTTDHPSRKPIEEDSELELLSHQTATQVAFGAQNLSSRPIHQGLSDYLQETHATSLESNQQPPLNSSLKSNPNSPARREFQNKSVYLVSSLGLSLSARRTLSRRIQELGAHVFDSQDLISKRTNQEHDQLDQDYLRDCLQAENQLIESDVVICEYRAGWEFWLAWELNKSIGTLHWILCILNNSNSTCSIIRPPTERLLDFPSPIEPIHGFDHPNLNPITISNYTGSARSYLIRLIEKMHIGFSGSLDYKTAMVVAANKAGTKVEYATKRGIQIVNHYYIEECFQNWSKQSIQAHHLSFPDGVNLCESVGQLTRSIEGIHKWAKRSEVRERRKLEMNQLPSKLIADKAAVIDEPILNNPDPPASPPPPNIRSKIAESTDIQGPDEQNNCSAEIVSINPTHPPIPTTSIHSAVSVKTRPLQLPLDQPPLPIEILEYSSSAEVLVATATKSSLLQQPEGENQQQPQVVHDVSSTGVPMTKHVARKPRLISNSVEKSTSSASLIESPEKNGRDPSLLPSVTDLVEKENSDSFTPKEPCTRSKSPIKRSSNHARLDLEDHHQSKKVKKKTTTKDSSQSKVKVSNTDLPPDQNQAENPQDETTANNSQISELSKVTEAETIVRSINNETPIKLNAKKRSNSIDQTPKLELTKKKSKNVDSDMTPVSNSNNARTSSTRKAAQLALKNVKTAVEDMNLHQKQAKSLKSNAALNLEDGGYFGKQSASKKRVIEKNADTADLKQAKVRATDDSHNKQKRSLGIEKPKKKNDANLNQKNDKGSSAVKGKKSLTSKQNEDENEDHGQDPETGANQKSSLTSVSEKDDNDSSDLDSISIELPKQPTSVASPSVKKIDPKKVPPLSVKKKKNNSIPEVHQIEPVQKKNKTICITQSGERIPTKLQNKLIKMGAKFLDSTPTLQDQCTHLLTTKIARTEKFLSCILLGCFIVNHDWAIQSAKRNKFLDEDEFQLIDVEGEQLHDFKLKESIDKVKKIKIKSIRSNSNSKPANSKLDLIEGGILNSFNFYLTPTVLKLHSNLVKKLILLAGGQVLSKLPPIEDLEKTSNLIKSLQKQEGFNLSSKENKHNRNRQKCENDGDNERVEFNLIISCKEDLKYLKNQLKSYLQSRKDLDQDQDSMIKIFESGLVLEGLLIQDIKFEPKYEIDLK